MQEDELLVVYSQARERFFVDLAAAKARLDGLLDRMRTNGISLQDLAQLEGLHAEKHRLFTDFVHVEERFVSLLLQSRKGR